MIKKTNTKFTKVLLKLFHKLDRYTKEQKVFLLYSFSLAFFIIFFPIIKITQIESEATKHIFLLWFGMLKSAIFIISSILFLLVRNLSYRFKNFIINVFWFRDNDLFLNFALLLIVGIWYIGIWDGVNVANNVTSTMNLTITYYIVQVLILLWLILTLFLLIKQMNKEHNIKIINIVDKDAEEKIHKKSDVKTLFDD